MASPFDDIFGGSGPQWTKDQIVSRIRSEATRQGVDPDLALAVATQESYLNTNAVGDNGKSIGLFQMQPAAAQDAGIDPRWRSDPGVNIQGGVRYLKLKLAQSQGDVDQALRYYNGGGDPNYVQNVRRFLPGQQPREQPGSLSRVASVFSPASAEAATSPPAAPSAVWDDIFGAQQAPPATTTRPPTAPSPAPAVEGPRGTPGPSPADEQHAAATIAQMRQHQPRTVVTDPAALLAVGGGPQTPPAAPAPVTDPAALLAVGQGQPPPSPAPRPPVPTPTTYREAVQQIEPLAPRGAEAVQSRVHEQGVSPEALPGIALQTLGTVGGAALGAPLGPVGSAAGAALGGSLATRANTALGLAPQEQPLLETPWVNVYPSDVLGAIPLAVAGGTSALKGTVRNLPGTGVTKHEIAGERLEQLGQRLQPARPSGELFTEAATQGGTVPTANLWRSAGKIVREEKGLEKGFQNTEAMQAGRGMLEMMRKRGGQVPLQELEEYRQRLGQKIGTTTDQAELARLRELYAALHGDLEQAARAGTTAGAATLREAIQTSRREHAHATLTDLWSPGKGTQIDKGELTQIYGKRIQNQFEKRLKDDKVFAGSFTPEELIDIRGTLREVGRLTGRPPSSQGPIGAGIKWLGRAAAVGTGFNSGDLMSSGAIILASEGAPVVLAKIMQSPLGRWALREAIREGNGRLTHGSLSAIAALTAREFAPDAPSTP